MGVVDTLGPGLIRRGLFQVQKVLAKKRLKICGRGCWGGPHCQWLWWCCLNVDLWKNPTNLAHCAPRGTRCCFLLGKHGKHAVVWLTFRSGSSHTKITIFNDLDDCLPSQLALRLLWVVCDLTRTTERSWVKWWISKAKGLWNCP